MELTIRPLNPANDDEINISVSFGMLAILETLPEARRAPETVPNFTFAAMKPNYTETCGRPDRHFLVAETSLGLIVGHSAMKLMRDDQGALYGYFSTRYVLPAFRRRGLARRFLVAGLEWMRCAGARYALAHTHRSNEPLRTLFLRQGFEATASEGRWPCWELRLCLAAPDRGPVRGPRSGS